MMFKSVFQKILWITVLGKSRFGNTSFSFAAIEIIIYIFVTNQDEEEDEAELKKSKYEGLTCGKPLTRTPLMTLVGHKEGVSGVTWMDQVFWNVSIFLLERVEGYKILKDAKSSLFLFDTKKFFRLGMFLCVFWKETYIETKVYNMDFNSANKKQNGLNASVREFESFA
jgi:hypothetical protein